jgi:hypothetical protein
MGRRTAGGVDKRPGRMHQDETRQGTGVGMAGGIIPITRCLLRQEEPRVRSSPSREVHSLMRFERRRLPG